tara:strand:- start:535 stop:723 length:189 start_codon:yes stop_codon:yes gene_type:complete
MAVCVEDPTVAKGSPSLRVSRGMYTVGLVVGWPVGLPVGDPEGLEVGLVGWEVGCPVGRSMQ